MTLFFALCKCITYLGTVVQRKSKMYSCLQWVCKLQSYCITNHETTKTSGVCCTTVDTNFGFTKPASVCNPFSDIFCG